jgi:xanthine dehydrogenase YagS FAD-binding subunit
VGRPIKDASGRLRAVLAVGTLLEHFQNALRIKSLPEGAIVTLVNQKGIVIARSVDGARWIGRDVSSWPQLTKHFAEKEGSVLKAGGIDLLDHLKEHLGEPPRIVDLKAIPGLNAIRVEPDGSLRIGPLVTLAQVAAHPAVQATHASLTQACGEAASPQIRNVATIGGNLLQRPRCWYYRLESYRCLKKGGDICFAVGGENLYHAIFAAGSCNAPHPSNAAVALCELGGSLVFQSQRGTRTVPAEQFFTIPDGDPRRENAREPDELLTSVNVPVAPGVRSTYACITERAAFDWPLASTAVALHVEGGGVRSARILLGAVATVPLRSATAEQALLGRRLDDASVDAAGQAAVAGAQPLSDNGYKTDLVKTLLLRTLRSLAGGGVWTSTPRQSVNVFGPRSFIRADGTR